MPEQSMGFVAEAQKKLYAEGAEEVAQAASGAKAGRCRRITRRTGRLRQTSPPPRSRPKPPRASPFRRLNPRIQPRANRLPQANRPPRPPRIRWPRKSMRNWRRYRTSNCTTGGARSPKRSSTPNLQEILQGLGRRRGEETTRRNTSPADLRTGVGKTLRMDQEIAGRGLENAIGRDSPSSTLSTRRFRLSSPPIRAGSSRAESSRSARARKSAATKAIPC